MNVKTGLRAGQSYGDIDIDQSIKVDIDIDQSNYAEVYGDYNEVEQTNYADVDVYDLNNVVQIG